MARRGSAATLAADVWQRLRREILDGELAPGDRLKLADIAERLDVSIGVVREALTRLASQYLVVGQHNYGFRVTTLSRQRLIDLTEFRTTVEQLALRMAIERGDLQWESELLAAYHRMTAVPRQSPERSTMASEARSEAHLVFHGMLIQACGYDELLDLCTQLRDSAAVYWRWSASLPTGERDIDAEHAAIMQAALDRDADRACDALRVHFARTAELFLSSATSDTPVPE
ncbi:MAG TPA: GntR family transcriptional regulator [Euzebyales bacterium]|nr:GntR family transcriptional regulator [Euzebyales bacterium]